MAFSISNPITNILHQQNADRTSSALNQTLNQLASGLKIPGMSSSSVLDALVGLTGDHPSDAYSGSDGPAATYTPATPAPDPSTYNDQGRLTSSSD